MSKTTKILALLFHLVIVLSSCGDQKSLDADREGRLEAVFESLKGSDAGALAANLSGLSREQASTLLDRISTSWGDLAKLESTGDEPPNQSHKGTMEIIVHWGADATDAGSWLELRSPEAPGRSLRIGILFGKESSEGRQFLAVEWQDEIKKVGKGEHVTSDVREDLQAEGAGEYLPARGESNPE